MSRRPGIPMDRVYLGHARWLEEQGPSYKHQATSQFRMILRSILKKKRVELQASSSKLWIT